MHAPYFYQEFHSSCIFPAANGHTVWVRGQITVVRQKSIGYVFINRLPIYLSVSPLSDCSMKTCNLKSAQTSATSELGHLPKLHSQSLGQLMAWISSTFKWYHCPDCYYHSHLIVDNSNMVRFQHGFCGWNGNSLTIQPLSHFTICMSLYLIILFSFTNTVFAPPGFAGVL